MKSLLFDSYVVFLKYTCNINSFLYNLDFCKDKKIPVFTLINFPKKFDNLAYLNFKTVLKHSKNIASKTYTDVNHLNSLEGEKLIFIDDRFLLTNSFLNFANTAFNYKNFYIGSGLTYIQTGMPVFSTSKYLFLDGPIFCTNEYYKKVISKEWLVAKNSLNLNCFKYNIINNINSYFPKINLTPYNCCCDDEMSIKHLTKALNKQNYKFMFMNPSEEEDILKESLVNSFFS